MILELLKKYKKTIYRFLLISMIISSLVSGLVYVYLNNNKTYTASVNFKFTNDGASNGYANDGTPLDFNEIKGAEVLKSAIEKFGGDIPLSVDKISANLTVEPVIPQEEQDKIDSALKNGNEYEYNPTEFKATLTTEVDEAAWLMQCIAESYYEYYAEHHVVKQRLSPVANVDKFDYIEIADLLRKSILQGQNFLTSANKENPDFRCSTNGYLFSDILEEYTMLYNNELPKLYAEILVYKISKDPELLLKTLRKKITQNNSIIDDTTISLNEVRELITSYSEKNKAEGNVVNNKNDGDLAIDENHQNIMNYVYENDAHPVATYDELFKRFNSEADVVSFSKVENEYYEYLVSVFEDAKPVDNEELIDMVESQIDYIQEKTLKLHEISREAKTENDAIQTGRVLKQLNTPYTEASSRVIVLTILAFLATNIMMLIALPILWIFNRKIEEYIQENYLMY